MFQHKTVTRIMAKGSSSVQLGRGDVIKWKVHNLKIDSTSSVSCYQSVSFVISHVAKTRTGTDSERNGSSSSP